MEMYQICILLYFLTYLGGAAPPEPVNNNVIDYFISLWVNKSGWAPQPCTYRAQSTDGRLWLTAGCTYSGHRTADRRQWAEPHPSPEPGRSAPPKHAAASGHSSRTSRCLRHGINPDQFLFQNMPRVFMVSLNPRRGSKNTRKPAIFDIYFGKYVGAFARIAILISIDKPVPEPALRMRRNLGLPPPLCCVRERQHNVGKRITELKSWLLPKLLIAGYI